MDNAFEMARAAYGTGAYDDATLEFLFPQLKESEDEKIRKWLFDYAIEMIAGLESDISLSTYDGIKGHDPDAEAELAQWQKARAYLEKQKEHQNNSDAPNESSWSGMISSSDKDKNLDEIAQDYVDHVKEYNPEPTWDLMQTAVCYGYHYCGQKEQKPAEWDELQSEFKNINEAFEDGKKEVIDHPEKYCLCKSAEWSEKDEYKLEQCIKIVSGWEGDYDIVKSPYSNFLKSLRPSWKPSEEQMDRLSSIIAALRKDYCDDMADFLANLYADLKKLM